MTEVIKTNPFVGLRPFESDESLLFFGRQDQVVELLQRLHEHHFVGVVGSSGSGKSSLIKAGLIPSLIAGYLVNERDRWLIPVLKPGEAPVYNMAAALLKALEQDASIGSIQALEQRIKEEGADAIIKMLQPALADNRTNAFILVDQFEELFRFSIEANDPVKKDEAIDFVNILLELAGHAELPVYVVMTMRSDFIGDCALFYGLPEALNQSQYLVPRLTREQLKTAIEGPVRLYGGKINPSLTSRLLNDVQTVKDELPLLQHVLMRTWDHEMLTDKNGELGLEDYLSEAVGGIEKALSKHADEALVTMDEGDKRIAKLMFQALTTTDNGGRKVRRPAHLSELVKLTGASSEAVMNVIIHFNDDKRSFLVINKTANAADPLIDISHESLIRQWDTLVGWVNEESDSAKIYLRLSDDAALHKAGDKDPLSGTDLQVALKWRNEQNPNATWASRYNQAYDESMAYLNKSKTLFDAETKQKEKLQKRKLRITLLVAGIIAVFSIIAAKQWYSASMEREHARTALDKNQRLEANYLQRNIKNILIRANSLKTEYQDVYRGMLNEADSILNQDQFDRNEYIISLRDSVDNLKKAVQ
jgi:hypothetical protein